MAIKAPSPPDEPPQVSERCDYDELPACVTGGGLSITHVERVGGRAENVVDRLAKHERLRDVRATEQDGLQ